MERFKNNIEFQDRCARIELEYPLCDGRINRIEIGLSDVRAADSIQVSYDFDRDGWVIKQASVFSWGVDNMEQYEDWKEVAFVQAWARTWDCRCSEQIISENEPRCPECGRLREDGDVLIERLGLYFGISCVACGARVSEPTGHCLKSGKWLCGPCAKDFYKFYKARMRRQNHCRKDETECFNEAAAKSIKAQSDDQ